MLKIAIIGCGKIADEHARQISRIPNCELVGFCDAELLMAKQMHDRFNRAPYFADVNELLSRVRPDVVHITTPPQSHFSLALRCLDAGCHVLVEKPFTLDTQQAEVLIRAALKLKLKVSVNHNLLFAGPAIRMRALIKDGFLGDSPVHMESYYGYELGDAGYARAFLGDKHHWLRNLPGKLLHNIISHGVSRIAEHLKSDSPTVLAHAFTSPFLQRLGEAEMLDELRVIIRDQSTTAYFTFSTQMRPQLSQFRVYGTKNALLVDDNHHILLKLNGTRYKSYLENLVPPISLGAQYLVNAASNIREFATGRLNMNAGMKALIERFYQSITCNASLPIPYHEILLTSTIMDAIFSQVAQKAPAAACLRASTPMQKHA